MCQNGYAWEITIQSNWQQGPEAQVLPRGSLKTLSLYVHARLLVDVP